jgi:hypothetical protein
VSILTTAVEIERDRSGILTRVTVIDDDPEEGVVRIDLPVTAVKVVYEPGTPGRYTLEILADRVDEIVRESGQ